MGRSTSKIQRMKELKMTLREEIILEVLLLVEYPTWREREMDQMKRAMEEIKDSTRRANHMDDLVHRIDSPFVASITSHPLPSKFEIPTLDSYDGTRDPYDHIATFKMTMHLQGVPDEIMCRAFPTTLKGSTRVWFGKLPLNTITSFQELSMLFINNFVRG